MSALASTDAPSNHVYQPTAGDIVRTAAMTFLGGIGCLIGIVLLTYVICVIMDRYCSCFQEIHNDNERVVVGGAVARDAGLTGISKDERRLVFEAVLVSKPYSRTSFCERRKQPGIDASMKRIVGIEDNNENSTNARARDELPPSSPEDKNCADETTNDKHDDDDDYLADSNGITCAICLSEYEDQEQVIESKYCTHMFHKECVLQWLEKHDVCPCCRVNMISSDEMKITARKILKPDRFRHLAMGYGLTGGGETAGDVEDGRGGGEGIWP